MASVERRKRGGKRKAKGEGRKAKVILRAAGLYSPALPSLDLSDRFFCICLLLVPAVACAWGVCDARCPAMLMGFRWFALVSLARLAAGWEPLEDERAVICSASSANTTMSGASGRPILARLFTHQWQHFARQALCASAAAVAAPKWQSCGGIG